MSNPLCNLNDKLSLLDSKKNELESQMADLANSGAAGMADLVAKAEAQKQALLDSIPLPKNPLPNFQDAIQDLVVEAAVSTAVAATGVGAVAAAAKLHKQVMDVKKKWGPAVDGLEEILAVFEDPTQILKGINIDICKQPNVDGKANADGTFSPKEKPPTSEVTMAEPDVLPDPLDNPVKPEQAAIKAEDKANPSDLSAVDEFHADEAITKAIKDTLKPLDKKIRELSKEISKDEKSRDYTKARLGVPPVFFDKNKGAEWWEYYILRAPNVPAIVDKWSLAQVKRDAYQDIKQAVNLIADLVVQQNLNSMTQARVWYDGKWNKGQEVNVSKFWYNRIGYGILNTSPEYGIRFAGRAKLQETKQYILNSFQFKPRNYTLSLTPKFQNVTSMRGSSYVGEDNEFANLATDMVKKLYAAESTLSPLGADQSKGSSLAVKGAYNAGVPFSDFDGPGEKDMIPEILGGNVETYEDILMGLVGRFFPSAVEKFDRQTFTKHPMYKKVDGKLETRTANSYEEHITLSNLGYGHNIPT